MELLYSGLYLGVFASSIAGSIHCVGMCSGLMVAVSHTPKQNALYHSGRLLSYLTLGWVAGLIGHQLFESKSLYVVQILTSILASLFFIWMGFRVWKKKPIHLNIIPKTALANLQAWSLKKRPVPASFFIGISSGLLPCGWLHTFVLASIGTGSAVKGALLLFIFWLGTVPALAFSRVSFQLILKPMQIEAPRMLAVLFILLGLSNLAMKSFPLLDSTPVGSGQKPVLICPIHSNHS